MKTIAFVLITFVGVAAVAVAQNVVYRSTSTAPVLDTPDEQIAYARSLIVQQKKTTVPGSIAEADAFMKVIAALEAVSFKWPQNRAAVSEALLLEAELFYLNTAYPNVLKIEERIAAGAKGRVEGTLAKWWKAKALDALQRANEADAAYAEVLGPGFERVDEGHRRRILSDASYLHQRLGKYELASDERRAVAKLEKDTVGKLRSLMMSCESNMQLADKSRAKDDLRELDRLLDQARREDLPPSTRESLEQHARSIARYHEKLGV